MSRRTARLLKSVNWRLKLYGSWLFIWLFLWAMASVIEISNRHILFIFSRAVSNLRYRDPRASFGLGNDSEASKGGMRVGRIKDPLYKDSQMGLGHLPSSHLWSLLK